jgi:hypothetical protein
LGDAIDTNMKQTPEKKKKRKKKKKKAGNNVHWCERYCIFRGSVECFSSDLSINRLMAFWSSADRQRVRIDSYVERHKNFAP